jgi:L-2,4-diaminobutyric acid acetyltransferase
MLVSGQTPLLRAPTREDGGDVWRLARSCGLDSNSPYVYLLWCRDFTDTSVIAEVDGALAGFVSGYRRPADSATLFVWQVAVGKAWRRQGLALAMLAHLRDRLAPRLRFVEASVTPSNAASEGLFQSLAASSGVGRASGELFSAVLFPAECPHDAEMLVRVGPFGDGEAAHGGAAHGGAAHGGAAHGGAAHGGAAHGGAAHGVRPRTARATTA